MAEVQESIPSVSNRQCTDQTSHPQKGFDKTRFYLKVFFVFIEILNFQQPRLLHGNIFEVLILNNYELLNYFHSICCFAAVLLSESGLPFLVFATRIRVSHQVDAFGLLPFAMFTPSLPCQSSIYLSAHRQVVCARAAKPCLLNGL